MKLKKEDLTSVKTKQINESSFCSIIQLGYCNALNLVFGHILYPVENFNIEMYIHDEIINYIL